MRACRDPLRDPAFPDGEGGLAAQVLHVRHGGRRQLQRPAAVGADELTEL